MAIIASYAYHNGKRSQLLPTEGPPPQLQKGDFFWIGLHEPTPQEIEGLAKTYNLHSLAVEDALCAHQVPKVEIYGDQLFVIAKTAHLEGDKIRYGETAIFVGRNHIITVRHGSARTHIELRKQLEASPKLLAQGTDYVLHAIMDFIVDGYLPVVQTIEDKALVMEKAMIASMLQPDEIKRLFRLRRQLILFNRILTPMADVAAKLANLNLPCIDKQTHPFFKDVLDHVKRVEIMVAQLREIITSIFEASNLLEQQRQGRITRQLAAWAAILAVPTAIAGIYGMNFEFMPELQWRYSYFVVLGIVFSLCSLLYIRFRKTGWL